MLHHGLYEQVINNQLSNGLSEISNRGNANNRIHGTD